ncbi:ATP-dependent DNA helicase RecG [Compostibacter hankyongensis]|uniref:ATP-dependent DNA helicase RecG n=1 Tax=Compostibacter hankyongensis TaxID=1007089 RepID=A0ABP8FYB6_9BACT
MGPQRGDLLKKELNLYTFRDLLELFPYRYIDKSVICPIRDITPHTDFIQVAGVLSDVELLGERRGRRLTATLKDDTGALELVWFQGISWVQKSLQEGRRYIVYGRTGIFNGVFQMAHPEMELLTPENAAGQDYLEPVYPSTEKLKSRGLGGRALGKFTQALLGQLQPADLPECLPDPLMTRFRLMPRYLACRAIHFPRSEEEGKQALRRLKFEELFLSQVRICRLKSRRHLQSRGWIFEKVGPCFNAFYEHHLPFTLTGAQKRVLKEIRQDTLGGRQMNRLLQGDVGSGKTLVALLCMLLAVDNGFQACLMAPTEILAQQHLESIGALLRELPIRIALLTGAVKGKERKTILAQVKSGELHMLIGTHALLEEGVVFHNLGLAIVDEQHRFGVAQRARLWKKNTVPPHILVMTATPIPRTLAMTLYGDLDVSIMDELPPGRQPIATVHRSEHQRPSVMDFIKDEIREGRQAYIVYPLIHESEKLDYENLMTGYENVKAYFPEPRYLISMVHGRQTSEVRETNMQRFVRGECQIMVATTVIEVGVNVPNATVMVIESAERFGLSQLHQLRGRVGRGGDKSYCVLMTGNKLSRESRQRIQVMVQSGNGFVIAEKDMELRGPGDIEGTRQSGLLDFKLADIVRDRVMLEAAREAAEALLQTDPELQLPENEGLLRFLLSRGHQTAWSRIS